jgi:hypothetical protein
MTPLRTCTRFTFIVAAFAAGTLIAAVSHRAPAEDSTQTQDGAQATTQRCLSSLWDAPHPPVNFTPVLLRVLQPSIEPVPATDELVHLAYVAQVTNTQRQRPRSSMSWRSTR